MSVRIAALTEQTMDDFFRLHSDANGHGWCFCAAWWTRSWEGWGERKAAQNRMVRIALRKRSHFDGFLYYDDGVPVGWVQVGERDRLAKLTAQYALPPDPQTHAITCLFVAPSHRGRGVAAALVREAIERLRVEGVKRVEAFPRRCTDDPWTGPESMFANLGFRIVRDDAERPVMALDL